MSQQQLDYSAVAIHTRRFLWRRRIIAIAVFVCSLAVTPVAIKAAWLSAGAGEGDYFWFRALFPGPIWAARIANHDLSGFVDTLMRLQFPVYGLIIAVSLCAGRRWWIAGLGDCCSNSRSSARFECIGSLGLYLFGCDITSRCCGRTRVATLVSCSQTIPGASRCPPQIVIRYVTQYATFRRNDRRKSRRLRRSRL